MAATNTISKIMFQFLLILLSSYQNINAVYYADDGLQQTLAYRHLPARDKYEMQSEILNLLGLHRRPKPKQRITDNSAPKYLKDLYKSLLDEDSGNLKVTENDGPVVIEGETLTNNSLHAINDSDVIISFVNEFARQFSHVRHEKEKRLWFDVSEVLHSENIMDAELRLYRNLSQSLVDHTHEYKVTIYKVVKGEKSLDVELTFIAEKDLDMEEGWLMFNVTSAMKEWVSFPQQNLGFYLSVKCHRTAEEVSPHEVGLIGSNGPPDKQPFMLAFIKSSPTSHTIRIKRETQKGRRSSSSSSMDSDGWNPYLNPMDRYSGRSCQKKTLYVSFRDLGWQDWIIAPDGYAAFFCDGECSFPLNAHMNATNHAIVQTLVHLMNPHIVPKPCCAPTKLSAIMVLYFDDNSNVILKKYKNMVVKSCGCH